MLFGIGVNLKEAPEIPNGRSSTCLFEYTNDNSDGSQESENLAKILIDEIYDYLVEIQTLRKEKIEQDILDEWKKWTEFGVEYKIRGDENLDFKERKCFKTVGIENDGKLKVINEEGKEELLEYFSFEKVRHESI